MNTMRGNPSFELRPEMVENFLAKDNGAFQRAMERADKHKKESKLLNRQKK